MSAGLLLVEELRSSSATRETQAWLEEVLSAKAGESVDLGSLFRQLESELWDDGSGLPVGTWQASVPGGTVEAGFARGRGAVEDVLYVRARSSIVKRTSDHDLLREAVRTFAPQRPLVFAASGPVGAGAFDWEGRGLFPRNRDTAITDRWRADDFLHYLPCAGDSMWIGEAHRTFAAFGTDGVGVIELESPSEWDVAPFRAGWIPVGADGAAAHGVSTSEKFGWLVHSVLVRRTKPPWMNGVPVPGLEIDDGAYGAAAIEGWVEVAGDVGSIELFTKINGPSRVDFALAGTADAREVLLCAPAITLTERSRSTFQPLASHVSMRSGDS